MHFTRSRQKRSRGCSVSEQGLGSKSPIKSVDFQRTENVLNMAHSKEVPDKVAEIGADSCRQVYKVRTRCFYNSKYRIKSVLGLFAKGNKKKYLVGSSECQIDASSRQVTKNVTPERGVCANNVSSVGNENVDVLDNYVKSDTQLCTISPGVNGIEQNDRWDRKQVAPVCPDHHEKPVMVVYPFMILESSVVMKSL